MSEDPYEEIDEVVPYEPTEPQEDVPPAVCPTCGRPWGDGASAAPGAGNVW